MSGMIEEISHEGTSTRHDEALHNLLAQHSDNSEAFLATVFGFMQRETKLLSQANPQRRVANILQASTGIAAPSSSTGVKSGFFGKSKSQTKTSGASSSAAKAADPATVPAAGTAVSGAYAPSTAGVPAEASKPSQSNTADAAAEPAAGSALYGGYSSAVGGVPEDAAAKGSTAEGGAASGTQPMDTDAGSTARKGEGDEDDKADESKGLKPNAGNGYDFERYSWSQTLGDLSVNVPVPSGSKGKGCEVSITKNRLKVGLKGEEPILSGELAMDVKVDECMWNLSDGRLVEVSLAKADTMRWWPHVLKDEPAINLQKVEPENSKISDLDGDTRATVEKMMYDQRQKQMGLPTAEEQNKNEMLQKFMKAHPEMDFSKAKFS